MDLLIKNVLETKRIVLNNTCIKVNNFKFRKSNVLKNRNIRFRCKNRLCIVTIIVNDKLN
jgi:hypothetical protein